MDDILQQFVDKLAPLQSEINNKTDEGLKQSVALAILEAEIEGLVSQRSVIEADAAGAGVAVADLNAAVMDAVRAAQEQSTTDMAEPVAEPTAAAEPAPVERVE